MLGPQPSDVEGPRWPVWQRVLFRFSFVYWVLYTFPFPLNFFIDPENFDQEYAAKWRPLTSWVGEHIFHTAPITVLPLGSGDTTFNYVQLFIYVVFSALIAGIWSLIDRKRRAYPNLFDGLNTYLRYFLGTTILLYGFAKILPLQFGEPNIFSMVRTYGESTPMNLLWTFMGANRPYAVFGGISEVLGGSLLFFRRTTMLGAIVMIFVMANVVTLNFAFDVPVKLFSTHLLLMAVYLLIPNLRRLATFFLGNRAVEPAAVMTPWLPRPMKIARWPIKILAVAGAYFMVLKMTFDLQTQRVDPKEDQYAAYVPLDMQLDGKSVDITSPHAWKRLVILDDRVTLDTSDGSRLAMTATKTPNHLLLLTMDGQALGDFKMSILGKRTSLEGKWQGHAARITLDRRDAQAFPLVTRGFHWINEVPFNR